MSKYIIVPNDFGKYGIKEKTRTHTGVRWLTIANYIDECDTLEIAKKKYPKEIVKDEGDIWFDRLTESQNRPSNWEN